MNKKLKISLIHRYSEQGFAMPIAIGLGFIMILIAATMIMRAQGDQTTASAQKATARSLGTSETGITRVQTFLNKYPYFIKFSSTRWTDTDVIDGAASAYVRNKGLGCGAVAGRKTSITDDLNALIPGWKSVDATDSNKGEFQVRSYTYTGSNGSLTVDGRNPQGASTALQVNIPTTLVPSPPSIRPPSPPGLFINISDLQPNQTVRGDVWLNGCNDDENAPQNADGTTSPTRQSDIESGSGTFTVSPTTSLPNLPSLPTVAPASLSGTLTQNYYIDRYNPDTGTPVTLPNPVTLPTADDIANYPDGTQKDGSYAYRIKSITSPLNIEPGKKVTIYLTGNIELSGNTIVNAGAPANLKIFGSKDNAFCPNGLPIGNAACNTTKVELDGTSEIHAYIFAPAATAGLKGGGNSERYQGALWVSKWDDLSSSNKIVIGQQITDWSAFSWDEAWNTTNIAPISSWQRQEAP
jgi:hypothetical protein